MTKTQNTNKQLRLLLAEDHEWARVGLSMSIEAKSSYKIVAEAENGQLALDFVREFQPDVVLLDIEMPVMDGLTAAKIIREEFPDIKVVMLTSHADENNIAAALACGANAYCMKDIKIERLVQVLEMVAEGATWYDPGINKALMQLLMEKVSPSDIETQKSSLEERIVTKQLSGLTERELDVLELIVHGKSNKDIADTLNITIHTVKIHVGNIIQKMGVEDRTQAAIKALQQRLVEMPSPRS
jgi:DNA-binding NarL/FixJ family response regulator